MASQGAAKAEMQQLTAVHMPHGMLHFKGSSVAELDPSKWGHKAIVLQPNIMHVVVAWLISLLRLITSNKKVSCYLLTKCQMSSGPLEER